ncbi:motility associated factor glycosyltransferase family protein [Thalassotalea sp. M1531]|uniref:Motility associated factor glycosyltransferase family protein n=1 Tax=Thalassotalea algicola TaxID=2716224 RepID=A0A7Y0LEX1_9GAMM|nr:6-hydroxymethylpterin diphosphokinase MptE-like protein [Thalassotalea algicola]NMP32892.1 motility associated factor glycosyltransferase family protein [Thalassotalea algicola]
MEPLDQDIQRAEEQIAKMQAQAERESKFADEANARFEENILTFKHYFPDIYEKFVHFTPSEKFQLLVNEDGSGNLIDYATGVPIYSEQPIEQAKQQVQNNFENPILSHNNYSNLEYIQNETGFIHCDLMVDVGRQYNKTRQSLSVNRKVADKIPSVMIFGVGLGYHLQEIQNKTTSSYITIFEPNEDYFYASLFCFDWARYLKEVDESQAFLYLCIGDSEEEIYQTLYQRVQDVGPYSVINSFFYQHYPSVDMDRMIQEVKHNFHQFFMGWGFFDDAVMSIAHTVAVAEKNPAITTMKRDALPLNYANQPVFIVANGPSLDDDIERLKVLKEQAIIVACNSATTALLNHGIIPDFHVALERTKSTADFLKAFIKPSQRQKINLLVLNVMYPEVIDLFGWTGVGMKGHEAGTMIYQLAEFVSKRGVTPTLGYSNPLVGNTALSFFCNFGFKDIYLFGLDKGYISKEKHHSTSSYYYEEDGKEKYEPIKMGEEFEVEGNFVEKVITEPFLYTGKEQVERLLMSGQGQGTTVYNCSNGVKLEGSIPLRSQHILLPEVELEKKTVIDYVKENCFSHQEQEFDLTEFLGFDEFEDICKTMVSILDKSTTCREEAIKPLLQHLNYLNSFKNEPKYTHLFLLLQGEAWYVCSVLIATLYNFGDSEEVMPYYQDALNIWIDFLRKAPDYYRERWDRLSDYSFEYDYMATDDE